MALNRGKANALDQELVDELRQHFAAAAEDEAVQGIILTGKERFFSAGLDLIALYDYDEQQIRTFWLSFMNLIQELTAWPKPLVAAISGHAPAGGCLLSLCADYRVMARGAYQIGLNEIPVGIIVPEAIFELYRFWIGSNAAHNMLLEGKLVGPEDAKELGIVNRTASEGELMGIAERQMGRYLALPQKTWRQSKTNLRRQLCASMEMDFDTVFAPALKLWWEPSTRAIVGAIVEGLKSRSKA